MNQQQIKTKIDPFNRHRLKLIAKIGTKKDYVPSSKELQQAYGYLDYCYCCKNEIRWFDTLLFNREHSFIGNSHKWWCHK